MAIWAVANIQTPAGGCGWDRVTFPWSQWRQLPPPLRDWSNESGGWRNWFGKQLRTGTCPAPGRDSGGLGAAGRRSPGGPKGIVPFPKPHFTPRVWPQTSPQSPHTPPLGLPAPSVCSFSSAAMQEHVKGILC